MAAIYSQGAARPNPGARKALVEPELSAVDCTGIALGNTDIEASSVWTGLPDPQLTPLPIYPGGVDLLERDS